MKSFYALDENSVVVLCLECSLIGRDDAADFPPFNWYKCSRNVDQLTCDIQSRHCNVEKNVPVFVKYDQSFTV